ncbi:MAG: hypothetical protein WKF43_10790 [Acidimicrobiales bacterium]
MAPVPRPRCVHRHPDRHRRLRLGDAAFSYPGFPAAMELRGRVYAPATLTAPAPLVLLMHGRHVFCAFGPDDFAFEYPCPPGSTEIPSSPGYAQLGETLASHGYVVASVSANSINANDQFVFDGGADARSRLLFRHLELFAEWNTSSSGPFGSRFVGRIDLTRVGLMGHSRGGEGVMEAAIRNQLLNNPYGIKAVVPLAPVDFGRRLLSSVPFGVILPYCDGDVFDLQGADYYDDARYRLDGDRAPKQTALLYGANHTYFNTVWTSGFPGAVDDWSFTGGGDSHCDQGMTGRLSAAEQQSAGTALIAGFIRRHVGGETDLQAFVTGVAPNPPSFGPARASIAHHDPARLDLNRFSEPSSARTNNLGTPHLTDRSTASLFCGVNEFRDSSTCPFESSFVVNVSTHRGEVGWVQSTARVTEVVPESAADVTGYDGLRFRVAIPGDARNRRLVAQNLTVTLVDRSGASASVAARPYGNALVRPPGQFSAKSVLNGVRIPLAAFTGINLRRIRSVELRFDRTAGGRVALSDLAFTDEGTGALVAPSSGPTSTLAGLVRQSCDKAQWANSKYVCAIHQALMGRDAFDEEVAALNSRVGTEAGRRQVVDTIVARQPYRDLRFRTLGQTVVEEASEFFGEEATAAEAVPPDNARRTHPVADRGRIPGVQHRGRWRCRPLRRRRLPRRDRPGPDGRVPGAVGESRQGRLRRPARPGSLPSPLHRLRPPGHGPVVPPVPRPAGHGGGDGRLDRPAAQR